MAVMSIHIAAAGCCWQCCGTGSVAKGYAQCGICHGFDRDDQANVCFQVWHPLVGHYDYMRNALAEISDGVFETWALRLLIKPLRYEDVWPIPASTIVERIS